MARSGYARFENIEPIEHKWALIRSETQLKKVIKKITKNPGIVLYTMINKNLEKILIKECDKIKVKLVPVLDNTINAMKKSFAISEGNSIVPGKQHEMDKEYFNRIEALQYAVANDDGQITNNLKDADIILVGVSRTSKSPTSIYLANKGVKVANIPFVLNQRLEINVDINKTLVIGLYASPERLQQIRKSRLNTLNENRDTDYIDIDLVKKEVRQARRLCIKNGWHSIDVSRKSIEEVAAIALEYLRKFKEKNESIRK